MASMKILYECKRVDGGKDLVFYCPGCNMYHSFTVERTTDGPLWTWNGDMDKPTFSPSLGINMSNPEYRCHSFVRDGKIQFLSDSYHKFAGQTVGMESVE